jgi:hypothetical protein
MGPEQTHTHLTTEQQLQHLHAQQQILMQQHAATQQQLDIARNEILQAKSVIEQQRQEFGTPQVQAIPDRDRQDQPRMRLPEPFDGNRKMLRGFLNQLRLIWQVQPASYPTDSIKVALLGSLLKGPALQWISPLLETNDSRLNSLSSMITLLESTFGDPDRSNTASRKIENLQQGRRPVSTYASEFRIIASDLDWNEPAKMYWFHKALNEDVKQLLLSKPKPGNLEDAINNAIEVDNRLFELRSTKNHYRQNPVFPAATSQSTSDPMIIDAAFRAAGPRGPLTPEERQRRMSSGLCLYCAEAGHIANDCPKLAARKSENDNRRG